MSYLDLTPEERAALIERQRRGWRSPDTQAARARDKERFRRLAQESREINRRIDALKVSGAPRCCP